MPGNQPKPPKRSPAPLTALLIICLAGLLYLGWGYLTGNLPWQKAQEQGPPKISWLKEKETTEQVPQTGPGRGATLHLTPGESESSAVPHNECLQTADKIFLFFEHLDGQNYLKSYTIKGSTLDHFRGIINKLMANPPVVVRETDDLFAILNNMAHFFRVLGPGDIMLIKDVLIHERELIEPTMALFYTWSEIGPGCQNEELVIDLPLPGLYEYAGYFINTLGGQSYLFRREHYLRLLIRYYSVLLIDRANSIDANRYGIDIRYALDSLISEIQGSADLVDREKYLEMLIRLQENYQAKYGGN